MKILNGILILLFVVMCVGGAVGERQKWENTIKTKGLLLK